MGLTVIFGVGIVSFFLLIFAYKLGDEHGILRYAMIIFGFSLLLVIPASTVHDSVVCEVVINDTIESFTYDNNSAITDINTTYEYTDFCYDKSNGSNAFMSSTRIAYYVFWAYIIVYLFILAIQALMTSWSKKANKKFTWKIFRKGGGGE